MKTDSHGYSIENYERPSVAVDAVVFGINTVPSSKSNKTDKKTLQILLITRKEKPFLGKNALPGGFLRKDETIEQALSRELKEETGLENIKLIPLKTYSALDRDPRGWILSCAYVALCKTTTLATDITSDAADAKWLDFRFTKQPSGGSSSHNCHISIEGCKGLYYKNGAFDCYFNNNGNKIAFDHAQIIYDGFCKLRNEVINGDILFELMPDKFTLDELQQCYEIITNHVTSPAAFRKRIAPKITETDEFETRRSHRPARIFTRKVDS